MLRMKFSGLLKVKASLEKCICRLFHVEGLKKSSGQLVQLLASLEQDKAIRGGLEPAFTEFLKSSRLHPHARVLEQCILSLL